MQLNAKMTNLFQELGCYGLLLRAISLQHIGIVFRKRKSGIGIFEESGQTIFSTTFFPCILLLSCLPISIFA